MKIAIYSNHSSGNADLARIVAQNRWDYSAKHGYDIITSRQDWKASWLGGLRDILSLLNKYDIVLTAGSDVLFTNHDVKITDRCRPSDDIVMAREALGPLNLSVAERFKLGWSPINNDVAIWRATPATRAFLKGLIKTYPKWSKNKFLWQQQIAAPLAAASKPLDSVGPIRLVHPRQMNSTHQPGPSQWQPGDWVIHFVGFDNPGKLKLAKHYLSFPFFTPPAPIPEPAAGMTKKMLRQCDVFIATPCYGANVGPLYTASVVELTHALEDNSVGWQKKMPNGEMVARARNRLVADFLESSASHLLFIDSDIGFDWRDVFNMLRVNVHIIGAVYAKKTINWDQVAAHVAKSRAENLPNPTAAELESASLEFCFNPLFKDNKPVFPQLRGAIEVSEAPTGFLLIHRSTVQRMVKAYPETRYNDDYASTRGRRTSALFDYGVHGNRYLSEDWLFCQRWRALGGRVYVWPHASLAHQGNYNFTGRLSDRLLKPQQQPKPTPAPVKTGTGNP